MMGTRKEVMIMQAQDWRWQRTREQVGVWEHRGKVAISGVGHAPMERRWDGTDLSKAMGSYALIAGQKALDDAGLSRDDIDGIITCKDTMIRYPATWKERGGHYFDPPFDSEDGISTVSGEWLAKQMGLKNVTYINNNSPIIFGMMAMAAQAVGDGLCNTCLVWYNAGNFEGRYAQGGENATDYARGGAQWGSPWGYQSGAMMNTIIVFNQYCRKYGSNHDRIAPFAVNQRRNGLKTPWGFYTNHEPYQITTEDYLNARVVMKPLVILDADRPVHSSVAYVFTTAERAKDMKQMPVYILNHAQNGIGGRSTMSTLEERQTAAESIARKMWRGSGLGPQDIDIFNPYDGYLLFAQESLEGFGWHGVKKGEAHEFYAGDIRVEGAHPFLSSGGNNGTGRTRTALYTDSIEQLRGTAGERQVTVRAETALAGACMGGGPGVDSYVLLSKHPS